MARFEYLVLPFMGKIKGSQSAAEVSTQLQAVINQHAGQGWEFCQLNDVSIEVSPGCFASLLGAKKAYIQLDQLILRRGSA